MKSLRVKPSRLKGDLVVPPSKSETMRALVFALMGRGRTTIENFLPSPDTDAMVAAIVALGARVDKLSTSLSVEGVGGDLKPALDVIDAKNSGIVLRFIGALAALLPSYTLLTGDLSIRTNRLAQPLLSALQQLGAHAISTKGDGYAPLIIRGRIRPGSATFSGEDSQPVSAMLIACSFLQGMTELHITTPGEKPWVALTLSWLDRLGIRYENRGFSSYKLFGDASYEGFSYRVPGDFSSASYPLASALLTDSELVLENLDATDKQGDKKVIYLLQEMGAKIVQEEKRLVVKRGSSLKGIRIDINECIDALPLLAVVGCFASGTTEIVNGKVARKKESDRIHAIATELRKMGARIEEREDGLLIEQSTLKGAKLESYDDHRIALSLAVAAMGAEGESEIAKVDCISKSYATFVHDFQKAGAQIT